MTEATPLAATGRKGRVRARVWQEALAAHEAGWIRATEVRASDFVGPGAESALGERVLRRVRQGKSVSVLGRADRPHTWSFVDDVARMLVVAGTDPRASGRAWHVPSNEPRTQRQAIEDLARAAGMGRVRVGTIPPAVLAGMGLVWPLMRELRETEYQFRDDFVMDSSAAQATFGLTATPWLEIVAVTAAGRAVQAVQLAKKRQEPISNGQPAYGCYVQEGLTSWPVFGPLRSLRVRGVPGHRGNVQVAPVDGMTMERETGRSPDGQRRSVASRPGKRPGLRAW